MGWKEGKGKEEVGKEKEENVKEKRGGRGEQVEVSFVARAKS